MEKNVEKNKIWSKNYSSQLRDVTIQQKDRCKRSLIWQQYSA